MIHIQFSIHDQAADAYLPPFILPRVQMAQRTFAQCVNAESHAFAQKPEDYTLFALGTWDDETAIFSPYDAHQSLGNGVEFVNKDVGDLMAKEGPFNGEITAAPQRHDPPVQSSSQGDDTPE